MRPDDFFSEVPDANWNMHDEFNATLANQLRAGTLKDHTDLEAGYALARLVKSELTAYGTDQSQKLNDEESALAIRTLRAVLRRLEVPFDPPFNDFEGWHGYWSEQGMTHGGSWAVRRGYVNSLLAPVLVKLEELEDATSGAPGFRGVDGELKNIIFASTGYKPEIILRDALSNTIEVVKHADTCLVYNRPLTSAGVMWGELASWWKEERQLDSMSNHQAGQDLFKRLWASLGSPPEQELFRTYCERYGGDEGFGKPALLPQVYLHYDPLTRKERKTLKKPEHLKRERMDFLLILPGGVRIVIEVDGQQHYSSNGKSSPKLYGEMMAEDRALRLRGYEVFRFGGDELMKDGASDMLRTFFTALEDRYIY